MENSRTIANTIREGYSEGKGWKLLIEVSIWENLSNSDLEEIASQVEKGVINSYFDPCGWDLITE